MQNVEGGREVVFARNAPEQKQMATLFEQKYHAFLGGFRLILISLFFFYFVILTLSFHLSGIK